MLLAGAGAVGLGLSPRVRGNQGVIESLSQYDGSIPACAGEPNDGLRPGATAEVYPRVCGGTTRTTTRRRDF